MSARSQAGARSVPARDPARTPCRRRSRPRVVGGARWFALFPKWSSDSGDAGRGRATSSGRARRLPVVCRAPRAARPRRRADDPRRTRLDGRHPARTGRGAQQPQAQPARRCGTRWQSRTGSFLLTLYAPRSDGTQLTPAGRRSWHARRGLDRKPPDHDHTRQRPTPRSPAARPAHATTCLRSRR